MLDGLLDPEAEMELESYGYKDSKVVPLGLRNFYHDSSVQNVESTREH